MPQCRSYYVIYRSNEKVGGVWAFIAYEELQAIPGILVICGIQIKGNAHQTNSADQ